MNSLGTFALAEFILQSRVSKMGKNQMVRENIQMSDGGPER